MKGAAPKREFRQLFQTDFRGPDDAAKIFRFSFPPNQLHLRAIPPHRRGAYASSRYVECGKQWTRGARAREALQGGLRLGLGAVSDRSAQGERRCCVRQKRVVLAPVAGVKLAEANRIQPGSLGRQSGIDGGKRNSSPGRARHKPSNHCAGKAGCSPLDLYARVRTSLCHCTRDRGCSAHPVFPAPSHF